MDGRGSDTKRGGGLRFVLEARDLPVLAQITNAVAVEAMAVGGRAARPVEDAGDHGIGIMHCQSAQERNCVLVRADRRGPRSGQGEIDLGQRAALPTQRQMGGKGIALDF